MTNTFAAFKEERKPAIDRRVRAAVKRNGILYTALPPSQRDLLRQISRLLSRGGKRLRPLLCILAYEAYGGTKRRAIMGPAASQELLHTFLLIHDDIIDRDFQRWGGQNILGTYFNRASRTMEPREALHYAEAHALLAGDICFTLANNELLANGFTAECLLAAQQLQQRAVTTVLRGELSDTVYTSDKILPTIDQVLAVYADKTASYSFTLPLQIGALLAGAEDSELQLLAEFGKSAGIAYQLQDDLIGMFGSEQVIGKPVASDLREGKYTILALKTLEFANADQRQQFRELLGKNVLHTADIKAAREIITESGAKQYVEDLHQMYLATAAQAIDATHMNELGKQRLRDAIKLLMKRNK